MAVKTKDGGNNRTEAFRYYELGRQYNNALTPNQYNLVNTNIEFYAGNQWLHLSESPAMQSLPRPTFNIIKRITQLFVASLTSANTTIDFAPLQYYDGENLKDPSTNAATYATAEVRNLFEKFKMDYRIRDALFDGAVTGDYCAHFYWNPKARPYGGAFGSYEGEIEMELVDGINVMFGNPNNKDVQSQPYVLIVGRDTVEHLRAEAELYGGKDAADRIVPDSERQWQSGVGGKTELPPSGSRDDRTGKALFVYLYTKVTTEETVKDPLTGLPKKEPKTDSDGNVVYQKTKDGAAVLDIQGNPIPEMVDMKRMRTTVHVTKATRNVNIFEDIDTGLTYYPIAWGNWEKQKNQYHGRALVTGIIPNQIFINGMMALTFRHLQLQSFPRILYNADYLPEGWNNEIGVALGVRGLQPGQDLKSVATTMQPADMSNQIVMAIDRVISYTKDCLGATDAQLGNIRADNTSALMVLQSSSEVPLENIRAGLYEWVEDIGRILLDMMGTYYGKRPIVRDRNMDDFMTDAGDQALFKPSGEMMVQSVSRRVVEEFDFTQFKDLYLNVSVNAGATTYYSEIAMVQTLDNLRRDGTLDIIDYLERIPDKLIPRKNDLIQSIKERTAQVAAETNNLMDAGAAMPGIQGPQVSKDPRGAPAMGGMIDSDKAVSSMPANIQAKYNSLPTEAQKALVKQAVL